MRRFMLLACVCSGCVQEVGLGPDLGACADLPGGSYRFGEAGIGTCIAGPTDIVFFEQDGRSWLAVSNADPQRNFLSGSVLVVDWASVATVIDETWAQAGRVSPPRVQMSQIEAVGLPIIDDDNGDGDGENAWLGGMGYLPGFERLIVTSRLTEGANIPRGRDELFVLDTSGLTSGELSQLDDTLTVEDDPYPVVVDVDRNRAFVGNLSDASITVVRAGERPAVVDIAGADFAGGLSFEDIDASGSLASITELDILEDDEGNTSLFPEAWTLTYLDASARLYVPTQMVDRSGEIPIGGTVQHQVWSSQGGPYIESGFGVEGGLTGIADPVFSSDAAYGATVVGVRQSDNAIVLGASDVAGSWGLAATPLLASPQGLLQGGPTFSVALSGLSTLYRDLRDDLRDPASIAAALSADGRAYDDIGAVLEPPDGESYEQPYVFFDPLRQGWRMYLSVRTVGDPATFDDDTWAIGLSHSDDGLVWSAPEIIVDGPASVAAPIVERLDGRYVMWLSLWNGASWDHASCWSFDGWRWTDPQVVVPGRVEAAFDGPTDPPRAGVLAEPVGAWRLEGRDVGTVTDQLTAGSGLIEDIGAGFTLGLTQGQEISNALVPDLHAAEGLVPGAVLTVEGRRFTYATAEGSDARRRIAILEAIGSDWSVAVTPAEVDVMLRADDGSEVLAPVIAQDGGVAVMFFLRRADDGTLTPGRATSADGLTWIPVDGPVFGDPVPGFDDVARIPHSIQATKEGFRLWYAGDDGSVQRIGYATAPTLLDVFTVDTAGGAVKLDVGIPGSFDSASVKAPLAVDIDGTTHLYYAGFGGAIWSIGHAVEVDGEFVRRISLTSQQSQAALANQPKTFAAFGTDHPVLWSQTDERLELLFAGNELVDTTEDPLDPRDSGMLAHIGRARVDTRYPGEIYATARYPTVGDEMTFRTSPGGPGAQVIELATQVSEFATPGTGMTSMALDQERGFLYTTFRSVDQIAIVDVRDDTSVGFDDANHFDLEGVLDIEARSAFNGFMSSLVIPSRDLLAVTMRNPEALVLVDLTTLVDDDDKEVTRTAARAFIPMANQSDDAGSDSFANIGGAGMALADDENLLLATHFKGNAVSVFDLRQGAWGAEVAWIRDVGESPHVVRMSPDGRYAVVANYIGEVDEQFRTNGRLAVLDLDPTSDRYLEVAAWLVNR